MSFVKLFDHQLRAIEVCRESHCRLIYRLPGTGKTRIGIEVVRDFLRQDNCLGIALWLGPSNLLPQYRDVMASFGLRVHDVFPGGIIQINSCNICSYEMLWRHSKVFDSYDIGLVICDEIHKAKSDTTRTNKVLWRLRRNSKRWYAFTGTPFQNSPYEFFEILGLCKGRRITAACEECLLYRTPKRTPIRSFLRRLGFNINRVNQGPVIGIKDREKLKKIIKGTIDYIPVDEYIEECQVPKVVPLTCEVEMTNEEIAHARLITANVAKKRRFKLFMADKLDECSLDGYFSHLCDLRSVAHSGSKTDAVIDILKNIKWCDSTRVLVFSSFVEKGLLPLAKKIKKITSSFTLYTGTTDLHRREKILNKYRSGEVKVLLLSPVGFEGLDLYGTTHVIIMEPHYNPDKMRQLVSRAVRAFSSVRELQVVTIKSVTKNHLLNIDDRVLQIAKRKQYLADIVLNVL